VAWKALQETTQKVSAVAIGWHLSTSQIRPPQNFIEFTPQGPKSHYILRTLS